MLDNLLTEEQQGLLREDRDLLTDLGSTLVRVGAAPADEARARTALAQLDELFLLVVAGEFNAGKSAVLNALLGQRALEEGPTPTTDRIHVLHHASRPRPAVDDGIARVAVDAPVLAHMNVVDTPGTNAVLREHEAITREFIPRSDMVLFVTSADRPFTESERSFLEAIRDWGKKVALVINKIDILQPEDLERVEGFVREQAAALLDTTPALFPVSARRALAAKTDDGPGAASGGEWEASRFGALESYIADTLDETERIRLKLSSPLQVGLRLVHKYRQVAEDREHLLAEDFTTLQDIDGQLAVYQEDLVRELGFRLADVETVFHDIERRGVEFLADTVRLGRIPDLMSKAKISKEFERKVVADLPQRVDAKVREILDWLLGRNVEQWQAVADRVAARRSEHADRIVGREGRGFDLDRQRLLQEVARTAQRTVEGYDQREQAERLAEQIQLDAAGAALLEAGAVGLGAAVALTALDATGLLAAGALAALGLIILPRRRHKAEEDLRRRVDEMRGQLVSSLREELVREIGQSGEGIREAVAPYTRFVRAERTRLDEMKSELDRLAQRGRDLASRIEALD
jgi:small GTP-binding protein